MKVENNKVTVEQTRYVCDTCGHKEAHKWAMERHEKKHLQGECKHLDCYYEVGTCDDEVRLYKHCRVCLFEKRIDFDAYHDNIAEIFNVLEKVLSCK